MRIPEWMRWIGNLAATASTLQWAWATFGGLLIAGLAGGLAPIPTAWRIVLAAAVFGLVGTGILALLQGAARRASTDERQTRVHRALTALDDWRQFGQRLRDELTGATPVAPLHTPKQRATAIIRISTATSAEEKVDQWIYEALAVIQQHTVGEEGRFQSDLGFPDVEKNTDPVSRLDRRLHQLELIISDLRAPGSERMVPDA